MGQRDTRWVVGFLLAGAVGLGLFIGLYDRTFPTAALDFKLSREQAFAAAEGFLASEGIATEGFEGAMVFDSDDDAQMFLEKNLGLQEANRLARTEVSIWFWSVRWFRPEQKEEFRVSLDPGGRAVGFRRLLLDTDPGADLAQEEALPKAEAFLMARGFDLSGYELIERSSERRERRTDHTFTYQKRGFRVYERDSVQAGEPGTYRLRVTIQGDRVGGFREFLKVPEAFIRRHQEVRSRANLLAQVAGVLWTAFGIAMIVFLIRRTREGGMPYETALALGAAVAVAWVTAGLNSLPLTKFGYDTQVSYSSFILNALITALLGGVFYGLIVCLSGMSGGACFSEAFGKGRPLGRPSWRGILSGQTARSALIGYGLACLHLGYVTVFYLAGVRYLGVWAPAETSYSNTFGTSIPWIYALQIGLAAATLEEFFFRLFAVSYLKRLLKRTWLAVLIPAVIWAFLHSTYAVEPIYIRGVELTVVGVVFGMVFLRFGIWATIISHYAYDAALVALPMIKSSSLYFQASGLAVAGIVLLPAAAAGLSGLVKKRIPAEVPPSTLPTERESGREGEREKEHLSHSPALPFSLSPSAFGEGPGEGSKTPEDYPLDRRTRRAAILAGLAGLALLLWARPERFGERTMRVGVSREAAARAAEGFAERVGVPLSGYRRAAWFQDDLGADGYTFLIRHVGVAAAESLAAGQTRPWVWWVRWYRPLEKEEVRVAVDARDGRVAGWWHALPEDRKGADLTPEGARRGAESFLMAHFGRDVADTTRYVLKESASERREGRRDHNFVWERGDVAVGEGRFRTAVTVQGDRVDGVAFTFKAPEAFLRELRRETVKDVAARLGTTVLVLLTAVWGTILFVRAFRDRALAWRIPNRLALLSLLALLLTYLNGLSTFFAGYRTATALSAYVGGSVLQSLLRLGVQSAAVGVALALVEAAWRRSYPEEVGPEGWLRGGVSLRVCGEALGLGAAFLLWSRGVASATAWAGQRLFPQYAVASGFAPVWEVSAYLPALRLQGVVGGAMGLLALLGVFLVWRHYVRRAWIVLAVAGVFLLLSDAVPEARTPGHFAAIGALGLLSAAAALWFVFRVVGFRLLAYLFAAWAGAFVPAGMRLIEASNLPFYEVNGVAMILIGLAPVGYVALKRKC